MEKDIWWLEILQQQFKLFLVQKRDLSACQNCVTRILHEKWLSAPTVPLRNKTYNSHLVPLKVQLFSTTSARLTISEDTIDDSSAFKEDKNAFWLPLG